MKLPERLTELIRQAMEEQLPAERLEHLATEDLTREALIRLEWRDDDVLQVFLNDQPVATVPGDKARAAVDDA